MKVRTRVLALIIGLTVVAAIAWGVGSYTSGSEDYAVVLYNADTGSTAGTRHIMNDPTGDTRNTPKYKKLMYYVSVPTAVAGADGTPGGLGLRDSAKIILKGAWSGSKGVTFKRDSCLPPCTLNVVVHDTGTTSPLFYMDEFWFDLYNADSTGSADTISIPQTVSWRLIDAK